MCGLEWCVILSANVFLLQARKSLAAHAPQRRSATPRNAERKIADEAVQASATPVLQVQVQQHTPQGHGSDQQGMHEAAGPSEQIVQEGNRRQSEDGHKGQQPLTMLGRAWGRLTGRKAQNPAAHPGMPIQLLHCFCLAPMLLDKGYPAT